MTAEPPGPIGGVIELRQYTLRPGTRDAFAALFDAELAEPQEAAGMRVLGQFRDLDRPDMFVWLRGFPDMEARRRALHAFYDGPVWAAHRDAANGMMLDSDDVLLLEPAGTGLFPDAGADAHRPGAAPAGGVVTVRVDPVELADTARFARRYASMVAPALHAAGGRPLTLLASLHAVNTFPRLPVGSMRTSWSASPASPASRQQAGQPRTRPAGTRWRRSTISAPGPRSGYGSPPPPARPCSERPRPSRRKSCFI